jgi:hypothetical protein
VQQFGSRFYENKKTTKLQARCSSKPAWFVKPWFVRPAKSARRQLKGRLTKGWPQRLPSWPQVPNVQRQLYCSHETIFHVTSHNLRLEETRTSGGAPHVFSILDPEWPEAFSAMLRMMAMRWLRDPPDVLTIYATAAFLRLASSRPSTSAT